jgi:Caspase domain
MRFAAMICCIVAVLSAGVSSARSETRIALVVGNSAYKSVPALPNPINDSKDMSASLARLGFSVRTLTNATYDDMRRALIDFGRQARGADIAVVFFAGHGIQMAGENWLIPVDAQLATDLDVANEAIGLQAVARAVSNTAKLGLVILDACRSNPFLPKMQSSNVQRDVERGFSRVEPSDNVLIAYAARDGTTASDGAGRNSPFTQSLLKHIETPGLEISYLFRVVRDDVMQSTKRGQQPFLYGSLSKEMIYLKPLPEGSGHSVADVVSGKETGAEPSRPALAAVASVAEQARPLAANPGREQKPAEVQTAAVPPAPPQRPLPIPAPTAPPQSNPHADPAGPDLVTDCDRLAGEDDTKDYVRALAACTDSMREHPGISRFTFLAGRTAMKIGFAYDEGDQGFKRNKAEARKSLTQGRQLLEKAAAAGNIDALKWLGDTYRNGWGVDANEKLARRYLEQAYPTP